MLEAHKIFSTREVIYSELGVKARRPRVRAVRIPVILASWLCGRRLPGSPAHPSPRRSTIIARNGRTAAKQQFGHIGNRER
jgi:hypothetical protein